MPTAITKHCFVIALLAAATGCGVDPEASLGGAMDDGSGTDGFDLAAPQEGTGGPGVGSGSHGASGGSGMDSLGEGGSTTLGEGSSEGPGSSETGDSEGGSTTGLEAPDPYGDCYAGAQVGLPDCPGSCMQSPELSACAPDCAKGCPDGPEGFASECLDADNFSGVCFIPCDPDCPTGMECGQTSIVQGGVPVWMCLWP